MKRNNMPAYESYSLHELEEALLLIDKAVYPERVQKIHADIAAREKALHPNDFSLQDLQRLQATLQDKTHTLPADAPEHLRLEAVKAELHRRANNPGWRLDTLPAYRRLSLSKPALFAAGAAVVLFAGLILMQSGKIQPGHPFVQDALYVAGQTNSVKEKLGDSLIVIPPIEGKVELDEPGDGPLTGSAWATITVKGDSGNGIIAAEGTMLNGEWTFETLNLTITPGDSLVQLMPELMSLAGRDTTLQQDAGAKAGEPTGKREGGPR